MSWIDRFQLFLFDFDGLLVNTEHLHYQAYVNMLRARGYDLDWSFSRFCEAAHLNAEALKEAIYAQFPQLEPNWSALYEEKKRCYLDLIAAGKVDLMPGAERLLRALAQKQVRRCVVTNSLLHQIELIRKQLPILQTIPHWITREDYERPKPAPDGYLQAIALHGKSGDRIIGFEDSIRGLRALQQTPALPILVCPRHHPLLELSSEGALHFESLDQVFGIGPQRERGHEEEA
jgi:HAD superfamily hydrolase (TIGR01509 family)